MATATQCSELSVARSDVPKRPGHHLTIVAGLFLGWGLIAGLNEILLSHLSLSLTLSRFQGALVQAAFFGACLFLAVPAAWLVERFGHHRVVVAALLATAAGAFLFLLAAAGGPRAGFMAALVLMASGMTLLHVSANVYVAVAGRAETTSSRLSLAHGFNSLGCVLAPVVGALMIVAAPPLSSVELHSLSAEALRYYCVAEAASVKTPYVLVGVLSVILAVVIGSVRLGNVSPAAKKSEPTNVSGFWSHPNLVLASMGIFMCVGAATSISKMLLDYVALPGIGNLTGNAAMRMALLYWLGVAAGQFAGAGLLRRMRTDLLLAICACVSLALVFTSMMSSGPAAVWNIVAVGLFQSIMFPCVFALGIAGLGSHTCKGAGVMIAGMAGGAVVPVVQGLLAEYVGLQRALLVPMLCYVFVFIFALRTVRQGNDTLRWSVAEHTLR